jgi:type II secretory pathway pseudopilin PulG
MKIFKKNLKGYSLVELVLAVGIFATISSSLVMLVVDSTKTLSNTTLRAKASALTQEVNTALLMLKTQGWYNVARHTDDGPKYLLFSDGEYSIEDGEGTQDGLTYSFTVSRAQRTSEGNLVESGGITDPHTRVVFIDIKWNDSLGREHSITPKIYINDWNTNSFISSTKEDFDLGNYFGQHDKENTYWDEELEGLSLKKATYGDWCNPSFEGSQYNLTGSAEAGTIWANENYAYLGTGKNASGKPFWKVPLPGDPPVFTGDFTWDQSYKTNDVFGFDTYALLGTNSNGVIILDAVSIAQVGSVNLGNTNAINVFAFGNLGFVTYVDPGAQQKNPKIGIFNLSPINQSNRPLNVSFDLPNPATDIFVDDKYIYLTLQNTNNQDDFVILSYTASSISMVGSINLNSVRAQGLYISSEDSDKMLDSSKEENNTRAYVVTELNTGGSEFYIINISDKTNLFIVNTFDTVLAQNMNPTSVAIAAQDRRAIIAGTGTGEVYTVLDITNESASPIRCGGTAITGITINAIALVKKINSPYTYLVTNDSNNELKIIRGGGGGGNSTGLGVLPYGEYLSQIFDSQSDTSQYYILSITADIPEETSIKLQLRASNSSTMSGASWLGPDGTSETYFEGSDIYDLPAGIIGRYLQYKIIMESDPNKEFTPVIKEIAINYEK